MNPTSPQERRRNLLAWGMDAGLFGSLFLVLIVVQIIDRLRSGDTPDAVTGVDLVFLLDQGPSMRVFTDAMKASCLEKAEGLKSEGVDCRFAVIPFGRGRKRIPAVPFTKDLGEFKRRVNERPAPDGAQAEATLVTALEQALAMDFPEKAQVFFFLISKAPCKEDREVAGIGGRMSERGITAIIQADASEKEHCWSLYQDGGRFFS